MSTTKLLEDRPPVTKKSSNMQSVKMRSLAEFQPGVTRQFGKYDIGAQGMVSGWASPEEAHAWSNGPVASFQMAVRDCSGPVLLTFEGEPFLNDKCDRQDITLHVNGFRVGFWRLTDRPTAALEARIEPEQMLYRDGLAILACTWYMPFCMRPSSAGLGADDRELGFCFRSLTLAELDSDDV